MRVSIRQLGLPVQGLGNGAFEIGRAGKEPIQHLCRMGKSPAEGEGGPAGRNRVITSRKGSVSFEQCVASAPDGRVAGHCHLAPGLGLRQQLGVGPHLGDGREIGRVAPGLDAATRAA